MGIDEKRLCDDFGSLVEIDSPSRDERTMCDRLKRTLTELGLSVEEDDSGAKLGGSCGNLYGFLEGAPDLEPLLFCAHMDTVEPSRGKRAVFHPDGRITSSGETVLGADDAAGIAAILEALRVVREMPRHRPLEVLFTVAEESHCLGALHFDATRLRSGEVYVFDLSGPVGYAAYKAPTIVSFEAVIRGKAAHAGFEPQEGIHAVAAAGRAIAALELGWVSGGAATLNIGSIAGGGATNIIPERCTVTGEARSFSHETALACANEAGAHFEKEAAAMGATVSFKVSEHVRAYETPPDSPVVERFKRACEANGLQSKLVSTFGGSDNNRFACQGLEGLVVACAMNKCHSTGEYSAVNELCRAAELALALMTL